MDVLPKMEGLGPADLMSVILIPVLVVMQVFAGLAMYRRVSQGERLTRGEALADVSPAVVLVVLILLQPFLAAYPNAPVTLAVAYVVLLAFYAAVGYGSLSRSTFHFPTLHGRHRAH